jgi:hypothetical protein
LPKRGSNKRLRGFPDLLKLSLIYMAANLEPFQKHQISGRVAVVSGSGGLPKLVVTTATSQAEIYAHGAHVTHFQKQGEPPLLFLSQRSWFAPGQPIRGGGKGVTH